MRERAHDDARLGGVDHGRVLRQDPIERLEKVLAQPVVELHLQLGRLLLEPRTHDALDVGRLLVEEDHAHPGDCRGGGELEVVGLEDEVDVRAELDAFSRGHREQPVVVEDRVERLDPLGVDVAVADDPALDVGRLAHHLARGRSEHAVEPLARVHVHVTEQLLARHRLWVHHVCGDLLSHLGEGELEHAPDGRLAAARGANDDHAHPLHRGLIELEDLADLEREGLELLLLEHLEDRLLERLVVDVGHVRAGEDVAHERVERLRVRVRELRERVDAQRLDEDGLFDGLTEVEGALLLLLSGEQLARRREDRLERAQPPVVVLLRREQLLREREDGDELDTERLCMLEALRVHHHLRDEIIVRLGHRDRPEERLEVVGQLGAAAVALARRVEGHKDAGVWIDRGLRAVDLALRLAPLDGALDDLDLLRNLRQLVGQQPVELVEAAPRAALDEADEDAPHGLGVDALVAVEDEHLPAEGVAERLDGFGLARARGAVRVAAVAHEHRLGEREVALVRERRVHELGRVALVLVRVVELGGDHPHRDGAVLVQVVAQLLAPLPVLGRGGARLEQLVDHVHVVDQVEHERLHLEG